MASLTRLIGVAARLERCSPARIFHGRPGGALWLRQPRVRIPSWITSGHDGAADRGCDSSPSRHKRLVDIPDPADDVEIGAEVGPRSGTRHTAAAQQNVKAPEGWACRQSDVEKHLLTITGSLTIAEFDEPKESRLVQTKNPVGCRQKFFVYIRRLLTSAAAAPRGRALSQARSLTPFKDLRSHPGFRVTMPKASSPKAALSPRRKASGLSRAVLSTEQNSVTCDFPTTAAFQRPDGACLQPQGAWPSSSTGRAGRRWNGDSGG